MNEKLEMPFSQDLLGFTFQYNATLTIDQIQANSNVTYLVYYAQYYYSDPINNFMQYVNLDVVKCTDPQLQGLNCVDFSKLSNNYTLLLDTNKQIISQLQISLYGCRDLDQIKTTVPDNCAQQQDIDNIISSLYGQFYLKLKTQQYNTTSMKIQTYYRNIFNYLTPSQCIISTLKTQLQNTQVSEGLVFQTQQTYSSPIQYDQLLQSFDRQLSLEEGLGPYLQENILLDEILQQFQIQYPAITEVLAQVNSITFIIIFSRIIGRFFSKKLIYQDIFMHNDMIQQKNDFYLKSLNIQNEYIEDNLEQESLPSAIVLPNFKAKFKDYVEQNQIKNSFTQQNILDFQSSIIQKDEIKNQRSKELINSKDNQQYSQTNYSNLGNYIYNKKYDINEQEINDSQNSYGEKKFHNKKQHISSKNIDYLQVKNIHKEAQRSMDIYQMYEDIIFLKKSISMLLSQEQLSAIQFVSLTDNYLNLDLNSSDFDIQYKKLEGKLNHFEKQFLTLQSQKLQIDNINKFIKNLMDQDKNNEIDKRIITSILKSQ
ncbi:AMP-binding enzyme family protein (macronuclear) [Tetrahymena thermophila SB210]|uniref:AMP-binding enzyme family protein n=1 Tax=Tetrahymena thermophila (strain SB210) TaxID=312017 RepID=Q22UR8_TETTS|nr:AMP-binding enzyme family protein [Tetrahymena thermophila SB210]EAR89058.2 AMP-binding enzyme family protein [Tetrahymena thermophila SB210]|eukprot:XP_001009303.2 AMP-binding enzyme family protein [Tetrahymena thermophila SB210]